MYRFKPSSKFRKQYKKLNQKEKEITKKIINKLLNNEILESKYKDHKLIGKYAGFRECHIKPDLLLIYKKENNASSGQLPTLILVCIAIGSHSDLF
ncbi:type II toxin-antitoxin system YafQ family toxin [Brachyspira aalborgi]|uniref:Type II toxin-antitoxin system YafQ family toxin n=1 Tax=Brachyspira aalborgi TaxID=29522 RepID=A0AB38Q0X3_9SPIR|nr:type II toxin-antitoxin system YafQ family toxin [Brachyspira aalborgi]TXJ16235.1 type II toxin-antitoxin system YafQ family toxin [Brachyspira aalborgi]TXJ21866.1 type II toxin-antitoxin system YafQ family toxin [Brachyspira aalborgi]TXJ26532.1 type II toxin-antitoxin system YafQ family toxin [Brachyspira aalborgi]TXJ49478.1 type II toxin-antitoxin system YafQ family toxin [Brachyspira aalborgi]